MVETECSRVEVEDPVHKSFGRRGKIGKKAEKSKKLAGRCKELDERSRRRSEGPILVEKGVVTPYRNQKKVKEEELTQQLEDDNFPSAFSSLAESFTDENPFEILRVEEVEEGKSDGLSCVQEEVKSGVFSHVHVEGKEGKSDIFPHVEGGKSNVSHLGNFGPRGSNMSIADALTDPACTYYGTSWDNHPASKLVYDPIRLIYTDDKGNPYGTFTNDKGKPYDGSSPLLLDPLSSLYIDDKGHPYDMSPSSSLVISPVHPVSGKEAEGSDIPDIVNPYASLCISLQVRLITRPCLCIRVHYQLVSLAVSMPPVLVSSCCNNGCPLS